MDRLFLDANVLWSASHAPLRRIAQIWSLENVALLASTYVVMEATRNVDDARQMRDMQRLLQFVTIVAAPRDALPESIELNEKDRPVLQAAIEAQATHLLSGDRDFRNLYGAPVGGVLIMTPARYFAERGRL